MVPVCEESIETGFHEISASLAAKPDQIYAADSQDEEELLKAVTDDESWASFYFRNVKFI